MHLYSSLSNSFYLLKFMSRNNDLVNIKIRLDKTLVFIDITL